MSDQRFGGLTVLTFSHVKGECAYWHCECECGNKGTYSGVDMRRGARTSCGCRKRKTLARIQQERKIVPGATRRCYKAWQNMLRRCNDPKAARYERYGGRGISVCDAWRTLEGFYQDMGNPAPGMEIERIDNNGCYTPSNCRWATRLEQMRNCSINRLITFGGQTRALSEWLEVIGIGRGTFYRRVQNGWTDEQAISIPVGQRRAAHIESTLKAFVLPTS